MKTAFVTGGLYTHASGIARILSELTNSLREKEQDVRIYTAYCDGRAPDTSMLKNPDSCISQPGRWMGRLSFSPALRNTLETDLPGMHLVHNHSMWMMPNHYASRIAGRQNIPVLFTAYGYLESWALAHSRWKKRLAGVWFQDKDLRDAACIHVNSESEMQSIRSYGLSNPVAVIPNGIHPAQTVADSDRETFRQTFSIKPEQKHILFMSRLHQKKGLEHLLKAWASLNKEFSDWKLLLAGPDDGAEALCHALVKDYGMENTVSITGMVQNEVKAAALDLADIFVLPSFSEGFSSAILEAMSYGCPVCITPGCNFPEIETRGAGLIVNADQAGTEKGLRQLMEMTNDERRSMGISGQEFVNSTYNWSIISDQMIALYTWLAKGGSSPTFIEQ